MAPPRRNDTRNGLPAWAIGAAALGVVAIIAAVQILGATRRLDLGETAETDLGVVSVRGSSVEGDETAVLVRACENGDGITVDLSALRLVADGAELEPSRSSLSPAEDPTCVEGSVYFATVGGLDEVVYLASPRIVWTDPAA